MNTMSRSLAGLTQTNLGESLVTIAEDSQTFEESQFENSRLDVKEAKNSSFSTPKSIENASDLCAKSSPINGIKKDIVV